MNNVASEDGKDKNKTRKHRTDSLKGELNSNAPSSLKEEFPSARRQMDSESALEKKEKKKRSEMIDKYLAEEYKKMDPKNNIMILLLGPSDSGKSTVLKQLILLHRNGFTDEERREMAAHIQSSIWQDFQKVVQYSLAKNIEWSAEISNSLKDFVNQTQAKQERLENLDLLIAVAASDIFKSLVAKCDEVGISNNSFYFFQQLKTIFNPSFRPTDDDMLRMRRKTEMISETVLEIKDKYWHFIDVAGQKGKRSRWITYMEKNITTVIYVFSCAAYNQVLEEQSDLNRITDVLQLYESILTHSVLKIPSIIVFFNKYDLLDDKLAKYEIKSFLKEYQGEQTKDSYMKWLNDKLSNIADSAQVKQYIFKTSATDRHLMAKVMNSVL